MTPGHFESSVHVAFGPTRRDVCGGTSVPALSVPRRSTTVTRGHIGPAVSVDLLKCGRCVQGGNFVLDLAFLTLPPSPRRGSVRDGRKDSGRQSRPLQGEGLGIEPFFDVGVVFG